MNVFLDCEFSDLDAPELLSVGLVTSAGQEFYAEFEGSQLQAVLSKATEFVLETVVPQFDRLPFGAKAKTLAEAGCLIDAWLRSLAAAPLFICYDYHSDIDLLEEALRAADRWDQMQDFLVPTHVGFVYGLLDVENAMERSWSESMRAYGVGRHHALCDARALREGFEAAHRRYG